MAAALPLATFPARSVAPKRGALQLAPVEPGPGLEAGSVLGCAYGRAHHCHWLWWSAIGRYCCSKCQPELHGEIPKATLGDLRLKG